MIIINIIIPTSIIEIALSLTMIYFNMYVWLHNYPLYLRILQKLHIKEGIITSLIIPVLSGMLFADGMINLVLALN